MDEDQIKEVTTTTAAAKETGVDGVADVLSELEDIFAKQKKELLPAGIGKS